MKKLLLVLALALFSFTSNAQFSVGASVGLPTGDVSNFSDFALSADIAYMMPTDNDVSFGFASGYLSYFVDNSDNASFLPLAGAFRFLASDKFSLGADFGYAVGLNEGNDGGLYYRPMVGYSVGENTTINLYYSGISNDGENATNIGLGVMFGI
tara:strand:+ start:2913 stop:3374 length:462 start_codon:yes stop_codon:yes gene_type:complete